MTKFRLISPSQDYVRFINFFDDEQITVAEIFDKLTVAYM